MKRELLEKLAKIESKPTSKLRVMAFLKRRRRIFLALGFVLAVIVLFLILFAAVHLISESLSVDIESLVDEDHDLKLPPGAIGLVITFFILAFGTCIATYMYWYSLSSKSPE